MNEVIESECVQTQTEAFLVQQDLANVSDLAAMMQWPILGDSI